MLENNSNGKSQKHPEEYDILHSEWPLPSPQDEWSPDDRGTELLKCKKEKKKKLTKFYIKEKYRLRRKAK